jgi:hypothetical protein
VGRDKDPKMAAKVQESHCRDRARANNPANSGLFAENQEISVRPRVLELRAKHAVAIEPVSRE